MMREVCIRAVHAGLRVCAPVHDGFALTCAVGVADDVVDRMGRTMADASRHILQGPEIRVDAEIVRYPDGWSSPDGAEMYNRVMGVVGRLAENAVSNKKRDRGKAVSR